MKRRHSELSPSKSGFRSVLFSLIIALIIKSSVPAGVVVTQSGEKTPIKETDLVDIESVDSTIVVDLKYSTEDNFVGEDMYGEIDKSYLRKDVAERLAEAQKALKERHPEYSLIIYDGLRPRSAQWKMWELVEGTEQQKYVAYPTSGSIHNYGAAVDLSIVDSSNTPLDMGTEFDYFGKLAQPRHEDKFLKQGKLSKEQVENRELLRDVMTEAGFKTLSIEWWHFNGFPKKEIKERYGIVEDIKVEKESSDDEDEDK